MTPSPFFHSSFPPCAVPPFGFGFGMEGLPPAFGEGQGAHGGMEGAHAGGNPYLQGMYGGNPYLMGMYNGAVPSANPAAGMFAGGGMEGVAIMPDQEAFPVASVEGGGSEDPEPKSLRGKRRGKARGREQREEKTETPASDVGFGEQHQIGNTTVMLRNIPNKYTREMLIKQLNQEYMGAFDFMYLPVDFRNKCNMGYGFINFRTPELCERFVTQFHGVDVRTCLPGLNSKKVAEVTPARVQGLEENVRRLRNSPVMNQLSEHPEWMPLLFNEHGEEEDFPAPDAPLPPVKPRGRHFQRPVAD